MKVCHITSAHTRYDIRIFRKECVSLAAAGYNVYFIVNDELEDEVKDGVKIISLNRRPSNRINRALKIVNCLYKKALSVDADIYHVHDPELLRISVKLAKKGKKVIFDSHEFTAIQILTKQYFPIFARKIISYCYKRYEVAALNKLSGLVYPCLWDGETDFFSDVHIPKVMIGNYPIKKTLDELIVDNSLKKKKNMTICYAGGISESRGIFHMVKACAILRKKLILIGEMPEKVRSKLETMPEFESVEYIGKLPHNDAIKKMNECSIGLCILQNKGQYSHLGNLPTKVYEYMALGLPVVLSDFPYNRKILKKYKFGLAVNPDNDSEIAEAINEILNNQIEAEQMSVEGKKAISQEMNWESESIILLDFYKSFF